MTDAPDLTLEDLLTLHPWPAEHATAPRREWFWTFDVPAPVDVVWRVVADSSRMNRELGVSEMKFEDRDGLRWGTSRPGGVRHEWVEVPWSWVAEQWITSVRIYERGFSKVVYAAFHLSPRGDGTRLYVYFGAVPRGLVGSIALRLGFPPMEKAFREALPRLAAEVAESGTVTRLLTEALDPDAEARLAKLRDGLHAEGLDRVSVDRLIEWVRTGDDQDLHRIQMRERARAWQLDEDTLLRVCLHATRAGLLSLSWDVVCPHCRGVAATSARLGVVPPHGECEVCGIDFGTDGTNAVEITFHVHPSIRDVPKRTYCSAEPATKDHIRVQRALAPGEEVEIALRLAPGRYRTRVQGEKRYGLLDVGAGSADVIAWRALAEPEEHAASGAPTLRLVNDADEPRTFIVEDAQWTDLALRPGRLLSFQEFRDLFGEEYLGADVQLAIGEQTILFTDMIGSTAMYRERGDPAAFVEVKRHFDDVFAIIAKHRGAVVKTIGDAAMAAFHDPLDGVKASKAIHDRFHDLASESTPRLRISLNTGPCIAVKLNTDIDYFGHTVNVAAKLQSLAESWQIAMSEATHRAPGVAAWIEEQGAALESLEYSSKAIPEPIGVTRWTVYPDEG